MPIPVPAPSSAPRRAAAPPARLPACAGRRPPSAGPCDAPGAVSRRETASQGPQAQDGLFPERIRHELARDQLDRLLLWCAAEHASDIVLAPGDPVWMQVDGVWRPCTDTPLTESETQLAVNETTLQPDRAGSVRSGRSVDYAYSVRIPTSRSLRRRFRVNATATSAGIYVVLRSLPLSIPHLADVEGLEPQLAAALFPTSGLVAVSGVMGSGKSTLLAAVIHDIVRTPGRARQVLTLEDPVEFDFSAIPHAERAAPIAQSAVHLDVEDWPSGVRSMTRRKGEVIMIGECRDMETIEALLSVTEQGVAAYTTVHAQDVPQTVTRMVNAFPEERRGPAAAILAANLRLICHQRLVPRLGGPTVDGRGRRLPGRVALREFLPVTEDLRRTLMLTPRDRLVPVLAAMVEARGQSLEEDARRKYRAGVVSRETYEGVRAERALLRGVGTAPDLGSFPQEEAGECPRP